jgi:hypothetical protein
MLSSYKRVGGEGQRPLGWIIAASARAHLEDKKGDFAHLTPKAIGLAAFKAAAIQGVLIVTLKMNEQLAEMQEQLNRGEQPEAMDDFDPLKDPDWTGFPRKVLISFCKSVSIVSGQRALENILLGNYTVQFVDTLCTDVSKFALRQSAELGSRMSVMGQVQTLFWTGANACALNHVAIMCVEHSTYTIRVLNHRRLTARNPKRQPKQEETLAKYIEKTAESIARCAGSVGLSAVGAVVGTLLWPGMGTTLGVVVGDTVMYLVEF